MPECNVTNRTIFCTDNLDVLRGINSECIDLIYLDPPFNKNKKFTAPIGSHAEGASFKDIFREEDVKKDWLQTIKEDNLDVYQYLHGVKGVGKPYNFVYLAYMAIRLIECFRVLKRTGSIYLHCDPTMSHYLKTTMDCIFGEENFRNEIVWCYRTGGQTKRQYGKKHDILLFYNRDHRVAVFNVSKEKSYLTGQLKHSPNKLTYTDEWGTYQEVLFSKTNIKLYRDNAGYFTLVNRRDYWTNIDAVGRTSRERTGYPAQKPIALLERIIQASTNEDGVVLDPFCGCATTCVASERLRRKWIGIDISKQAYNQVKNRLLKEKKFTEESDNQQKPDNTEITLQTEPLQRNDQGEHYREQKYVYVISNRNCPGEFKVGIAKDVKLRLNAFQTSDPKRQFQLRHSLKTPWYREIETHIYKKFPNKHEWVSGKLENIVSEIENFQPSHHDGGNLFPDLRLV
ncbi:MAG: DNA methyltransferase [Gammaproteobacteria bacterium]|nr:DNA methyltransferase [Gammaproteobacteria bacterium]MDE0252358.1 DNA methyltransferase [Gammaproteobacteria bacterium]MDE0402533.1 DNA methyltransferase [Gammaproteobacteria bacterium]